MQYLDNFNYLEIIKLPDLQLCFNYKILIVNYKVENVKNWAPFHVIFDRISAEISAELSVNLAEISVSAETDFSRFGRSLLR